MRVLPLLIISFSICCLSIFAQYDDGTVIYSNTNLFPISPNYIVEDFDGDFIPDIIMIIANISNNTNQLTWYKGDGNGNFSEQDNIMEVKEAHKENEIYFKDMNGDEISDIVFQNSSIGFSILLNGGNGDISKQKDDQVTMESSCGANLKELADVDGDCDLDCIFWNKIDCTTDGQHLGYCLIGYNDGNGVFKNYDYLDNDNLEMFLLIEAGDIDGDDNVDIISSGIKPNDDNNELFVRLYKNNGSVKEEIILPNEIRFANIAIKDIDSNGNDELLIEFISGVIDNHGESAFHDWFQLLHYSNKTKTFIILDEYDSWFHNYLPKLVLSNELYNSAFQIQFDYQNTDNNLDILGINALQESLRWYSGDGNGGFKYDQTQIIHINHDLYSNKPTLRVTDFDGDGDLDVFVLFNKETSSTLTVFENITPVSTENHNLFSGKNSIIPNPVSGNSNVHLAHQIQSRATYNLYTIEGSKLMTSNVEDSRIYIPDLPKGMYLVEVISECHRYLNKLLIN